MEASGPATRGGRRSGPVLKVLPRPPQSAPEGERLLEDPQERQKPIVVCPLWAPRTPRRQGGGGSGGGDTPRQATSTSLQRSGSSATSPLSAAVGPGVIRGGRTGRRWSGRGGTA